MSQTDEVGQNRQNGAQNRFEFAPYLSILTNLWWECAIVCGLRIGGREAGSKERQGAQERIRLCRILRAGARLRQQSSSLARSAHPPEGFYRIGDEVSYTIKKESR